jgi:hypothetical protein
MRERRAAGMSAAKEMAWDESSSLDRREKYTGGGWSTKDAPCAFRSRSTVQLGVVAWEFVNESWWRLAE